MNKKESTVKWFIIALIPIVNLYYLWKLAEVISGHEKGISGNYEVTKHMERKESTGKWFAIFLVPAIIVIVAGAGMFAGALVGGQSAILGGAAVLSVAYVIGLIIGLYILYKTALYVSGHEKKFDEFERVGHRDRKESTIKWMIFGLIPLLNIYFAWKTAEMVSGHEVVHG